jgi:DMSO/TMAO reductase YedYZ heme-binding membrane subunit
MSKNESILNRRKLGSQNFTYTTLHYIHYVVISKKSEKYGVYTYKKLHII